MRTLLALILGTTAAIAAPDPTPDRWAPFTTTEKRAFVAMLRKDDHGSVTIACPLRTCAALATSLEDAFAEAGWHVTKLRKGGLGITGVQGIRVSGCNDPRLVAIAHALAARTSPNVTEVDVNAACTGADEIIIVIGDRL